jgi:iduronate 2-sulfatase
MKRAIDRVARLAIIASVLMCGSLPGFAAAPRLNVLFIAVDDYRPEAGAYGVDEISTPNIDALAQQGITFTRAYSQMAVCNPSRASMLTGLRPDSTGVTLNQTHFRTAVPNVVTLPEWFKQNGYQTQANCKVFHGGLEDDQSWTLPRKTGHGPDTGLGPYALYGPDGKLAAFGVVDRPESEFNGYKCADFAIQSINALRDSPFFIAVGFQKPHVPFVTPPKYYDLYDKNALPESPNPFHALGAPSFAFSNMSVLRRDYSGIPATGPFDETLRRNLKHGYYAATSFADAQIGRVLAALDAAGLSENTLVVLWGDHGFHLGDQAEWGKETNFDVGTRVPLIFKGPGVPASAFSSALVELVDLYPTIAELAGLPIPNAAQHGGLALQGDTLVPFIQDPSVQSPRGAFSQWIRSGWDGRSLRTERYRFTEWTSSGAKVYELYDHDNDPLETVNVAADPDYAAILPVLRTALAAGGQSDLPAELTDANLNPTVDITSPADGSSHTAGSTIALGAATSDPDGDPVSVAWTANGTPVAAPWTPAAGTYTVVATASDGKGGSATDTVSTTVTATGSGTLPATVAAAGVNPGTAARIVDTLNGVQNLSTSWSNDGANSTAWFTLDLGSARAVERLLMAPRGGVKYTFTVTIGNTLSGGKVSGAATGSCVINGGTTVPTSLTPCAVSGVGRYVTVQGSRPWLIFHGIEVVGSAPASPDLLPATIHDAGSNDATSPRIIDVLNGAQNLTTSWTNDGVNTTAWFTLDLGSQQSVGRLMIAPRGGLKYILTITIGDTVAGGKVTGAAAGTCTITGPTTVPTALTLCPVSGTGRYVTIQGNRPYLVFHGIEAWKP